MNGEFMSWKQRPIKHCILSELRVWAGLGSPSHSEGRKTSAPHDRYSIGHPGLLRSAKKEGFCLFAYLFVVPDMRLLVLIFGVVVVWVNTQDRTSVQED